MQLDRNMLERLLTMNDEQLAAFIRSIATESGIDPTSLGLDPHNVQALRLALSSATDRDVEGLDAIYRDYRNKRRNP
jgi:hypothetical protein